MCSRSLSLSRSPAFLPCCCFFQIVLSLLLATHQLHPHHLSKLFAYSLLITFPSSLQELPGASRWHLLLPCFLHSCHAHSFSHRLSLGFQSSLPSVFGSPHVLFPRGLVFKSPGLLFLTASALPAFSLGTFHQGKKTLLFQPAPLTQPVALSLPGPPSIPVLALLPSRPAAQTVVPARVLTPGASLFIASSSLLLPFQFVYPHPIFRTMPLNQDCFLSPYWSLVCFTYFFFPHMPLFIPSFGLVFVTSHPGISHAACSVPLIPTVTAFSVSSHL